MKKVLIAVDDSRTSESVVSVFKNLVKPPEEVILLHVERLEGRSLMIDMLGEAELSTLKESLEGTDYKEELDRKAERILDHYKKRFEASGLFYIRTMIREGIPSEEIARVVEEENVELVIVGYSGKKGLDRLITGCVSKEVEKSSRAPVIVAREKAKEGTYGLKEAEARM
jgi:nucleotide-binding universal stress UspA family protein